jgi:hypothetical protein
MALQHELSADSLQWLAVRAIAAILAIFAVRFLYQGYQARKRVRALKAQGIVRTKFSKSLAAG